MFIARLLFLISIFGVMAVAPSANAQLVLADDGHALYQHCKWALMRPDAYTPEEGFCVGTAETLIHLARILPDAYCFCPPRNISHEIVLRVLVEYLENRPQNRDSALWQIADAAFQAAWPCRD